MGFTWEHARSSAPAQPDQCVICPNVQFMCRPPSVGELVPDPETAFAAADVVGWKVAGGCQEAINRQGRG